MQLLQTLLTFCILLLSCKLLSVTEKLFRSKSHRVVKTVIDTWSLSFFKIGLYIILLFGSIEFTLLDGVNNSYYFPGFFLIVTGILLRCYAIHSLGTLWSYDIKLYENHQFVRTGIYRYIKHPAYLGNIYLVGIFLILNSFVTAVISLFFITSFYVYRSKIEDRLLLYEKSASGSHDMLSHQN